MSRYIMLSALILTSNLNAIIPIPENHIILGRIDNNTPRNLILYSKNPTTKQLQPIAKIKAAELNFQKKVTRPSEINLNAEIQFLTANSQGYGVAGYQIQDPSDPESYLILTIIKSSGSSFAVDLYHASPSGQQSIWSEAIDTKKMETQNNKIFVQLNIKGDKLEKSTVAIFAQGS